jgi:drug/metabolite transporter (DMT)-like permease
MTRIPMAEVTAMNYMNPVYITIGAALVLGERLAWPRMTAIGVAVIGGFIILRPGFREIDLGHIAMIATAMLFAVSYLIAGKASRDVSATVVVAMLSLMVPVAMAPFAIAVWVTPTLPQLGWLFLVAGFATMGHYTMTRAFAAAPMAVTQPVMFLQLVWSTAIGWAIFGEGVDAWVIIGGAIVLGAVTFITWREARKKRANAAR